MLAYLIRLAHSGGVVHAAFALGDGCINDLIQKFFVDRLLLVEVVLQFGQILAPGIHCFLS